MRYNPLAKGAAAPSRRLARHSTPKESAKENTLSREVLALSLETFCCLLGSPDLARAEKTRAEFAAYCATSRCREWRNAWRSWKPAAPLRNPTRAERAASVLRDL